MSCGDTPGFVFIKKFVKLNTGFYATLLDNIMLPSKCDSQKVDLQTQRAIEADDHSGSSGHMARGIK